MDKAEMIPLWSDMFERLRAYQWAVLDAVYFILGFTCRIDDALQARLENLTLQYLTALRADVMQFRSQADLEQWLDAHENTLLEPYKLEIRARLTNGFFEAVHAQAVQRSAAA